MGLQAPIQYQFTILTAFSVLFLGHTNSLLSPPSSDFFKANTICNNLSAKQVFAISSWFAPHPKRYLLGRPAQIWCKGLFEVDGTHSFVPSDLLVSQCAHCIKTIEEIHETVLIVVSVAL